jgi:deoxyribose-phosphate aldolase
MEDLISRLLSEMVPRDAANPRAGSGDRARDAGRTASLVQPAETGGKASPAQTADISLSPDETARRKARIAPLIDHTQLKPEATEADIRRLCEEAVQYGFATVFVHPCWVKDCARWLRGSRVKVGTVVGFPFGANHTRIKAAEAAQDVRDGADELDMVINVGWLKSGKMNQVKEDIRRVVQAAHGKPVKVIIETCLLTDEEKVRACLAAKTAGAAFVKTSTGFNKAGATVSDVALLRRVVGPEMGVKASGGIRDLTTALQLVEAGATRIGTSAGVKIMGE